MVICNRDILKLQQRTTDLSPKQRVLIAFNQSVLSEVQLLNVLVTLVTFGYLRKVTNDTQGVRKNLKHLNANVTLLYYLVAQNRMVCSHF